MTPCKQQKSSKISEHLTNLKLAKTLCGESVLSFNYVFGCTVSSDTIFPRRLLKIARPNFQNVFKNLLVAFHWKHTKDTCCRNMRRSPETQADRVAIVSNVKTL